MMYKLFFIFLIILFIVLNLNRFNESFECPITQMELSPKLSKKDIENLKKGQQIMTNIFREFDRICRKYNLKYWCVGGTFIGAIRHNGWIPWDGDIDVGMLEEDYNKFKKVKEELPKRMWLQDKTTDINYNSNICKIRDIYTSYTKIKNRKWHNGLQLDIFVFKKNKEYIYSDNYGIIVAASDKKKRLINDIFPLQEFNFEDIKVYIPHEYKNISIELWGDYPPPLLPIKKRYPHEGGMDPNKPSETMIKMYPKLYSL
jgi:phosphorylcholine metabolism protein LicD